MAKKQEPLPGLGRTEIEEVQTAAETYRAARDARMALMAPEKEGKTNLLTMMKKHKLKEYRYEGENADGELVEFTVERESKENVKVRTAKEETEEEAGEEPEED